ncbi:MAG: putative manganese transporter [Eubacteriales bacterium]|nr:putative manganese transporter [Eubacterium sp.]MDY5494170.1 putative manganese transporter [Eubacteriales bacterium]
MIDVLLDTLLDAAKLIPFLYLTYLLLEFIEHRAKEQTEALMKKAGKWGPFLGGALGAVPQCGFSASMSNLYAENIISMGTLVAVFLSTSDEMLPIMISGISSGDIRAWSVVKILLVKILLGVVVGFIVDGVARLCSKKEKNIDIESLCHDDHCGCEEGNIFLSAFIHTLKILAFILVVSFALNTVIYFIGEDALGNFISSLPVVVGPLATALVGLVPNCASSIVITQLYMSGVISAGSMLAGLLSGSGIGLLILFRVNKNMKSNFAVLGIVYGSGAVIGIICDLLKVTF